uniref:Aurora kinase C n=1 Tax=Homo sapiens TaxID=9606 RepID=M0QX60_HUMAN
MSSPRAVVQLGKAQPAGEECESQRQRKDAGKAGDWARGRVHRRHMC